MSKLCRGNGIDCSGIFLLEFVPGAARICAGTAPGTEQHLPP